MFATARGQGIGNFTPLVVYIGLAHYKQSRISICLSVKLFFRIFLTLPVDYITGIVYQTVSDISGGGGGSG